MPAFRAGLRFQSPAPDLPDCRTPRRCSRSATWRATPGSSRSRLSLNRPTPQSRPATHFFTRGREAGIASSLAAPAVAGRRLSNPTARAGLPAPTAAKVPSRRARASRRSIHYELDATVRFAFPTLTDRFHRMPAFRDGVRSQSRRPILPVAELTDAAAPRAGPAAPGASSSRPLLNRPSSRSRPATHFLTRGRRQGSHHGWRRPPSPLSPFAHHFLRSGQLQVLDDARDNLGRFGVRGAPNLDTFLLDAGLPRLSSSCSRSWPSTSIGSPASRSRSRTCGQPSPLGRSPRNSTVPGDLLPLFPLLARPLQPSDSWTWIAPCRRHCHLRRHIRTHCRCRRISSQARLNIRRLRSECFPVS